MKQGLQNIFQQNKNTMIKSILLLATVFLFSTAQSQSPINNAKTAVVKVYGNCGICKTSIEKAAFKKRIATAEWNADTKMASITYDSIKTNIDAVLKNIALAGYDNQNFLAPDEAYNKLQSCCKYTREEKHLAIVTQPVKDIISSVQDHTIHKQEVIANVAKETIQKQEATTEMKKETIQKQKEITKVAKETNPLTPVFDNYFLLKDALVKTDGAAAAAKAKNLQVAINTVKMAQLSTEVHMVWMKVLNDLKTAATQITETKDIAKQRNYFMGLSKNMYAVIKVSKTDETIYYQFCPMANDGKGANWLSKEQGIKNPYYGAQMLTCGKTVETIKQ